LKTSLNIDTLEEVISMSRKSKQPKHKKSLATISSQADKLVDLISYQIFHKDYTEAIANCERLLSYLPQRAPQRVEVLAQLGTAHAMLQNFPQSYQALTEALAIDPNNADLLYNRGMASRFTSRFGQSFRDFERAVELNTDVTLTKQFAEALKVSRKFATESMKQRGPNFTLDQLIEQEEHFHRGIELMEAGRWDEAAQAFQASIAMGDCLPQPWGNLGISLIMQERYDEAEAALKRALVIDPRYAIAKRNLAALPETRRTGPPKMVEVSDPFKNAKIKQSITFRPE